MQGGRGREGGRDVGRVREGWKEGEREEESEWKGLKGGRGGRGRRERKREGCE